MPPSAARSSAFTVALLVLTLRSGSIPLASPLRSSTCPVVLPSFETASRSASGASPQQRIIGGIPVQASTQSYLVSLSNANNTFVCSGSLISRRWVLTAAHCDVTVHWRARVGTWSATSGSYIAIFQVIKHPSYVVGRVDSAGDIALIQLAHDAPEHSSFVAVNVNSSLPVAGSFARTSGYGRTGVHASSGNAKPNQVDTPVNSGVRCREIYRGYLHIRHNLFICAGYGKDECHADSCNGDSGGPLVQYDEVGRAVQMGITSFGLRCGDNGVPGVYIRLSSYVEWMAQNGAEFSTSSSVIATFAAGSAEAASDVSSSSIQESQMGFPRLARRKNTLVIPTVWFAVICVIAGISLISLIVLSLVFVVSGGRECSDHSTAQSGEGADGAALERQNVQHAIQLLQSVVNDVSQPSPKRERVVS